jgi:hypothetical protein
MRLEVVVGAMMMSVSEKEKQHEKVSWAQKKIGTSIGGPWP